MFTRTIIAKPYICNHDTPLKVAKVCRSKKCKGRTYKVYLIRHGQSEWNDVNKFTGWYDVPLTERGKEEAVIAGKMLRDAKVKFDVTYSSVLKRSTETIEAILKECKQRDVPICTSWRLNERHYGELTGLNKISIMEKYGEDQVKKWRRGYADNPPPMKKNHRYYKDIVKDPMYKHGPPLSQFPMYESLKLTILRVLPYWTDTIVPQIKSGKTVLICGHGNSLRGIVKHLDSMSDDAITELDIPNGLPFYYELDYNMKPVPGGSLKYMGDPEKVAQAFKFLNSQSRKKL